jgi:hypothetical protein
VKSAFVQYGKLILACNDRMRANVQSIDCADVQAIRDADFPHLTGVHDGKRTVGVAEPHVAFVIERMNLRLSIRESRKITVVLPRAPPSLPTAVELRLGKIR